MHSPPTISVITVTFNLIEAGRCESFERAVACVREQGDEGIEHVIQDGGSTDGTQEFILGLVGNAPAVRFESAPDTGLYDGMNKAVARATGDYVLFLNSDDALASPTVLGEVRKSLDREKPDFAYGATASQDDQGRAKVASRMSLNAVLQRMPFCHNSVLIRRTVFDALGGHDTSYPVAADYDLVLRMVAAGYRGMKINRPVSLFWTRGVSANADKVSHDYARIWQRFFRNHKSAQALGLEDFKSFYRRGHMPLGLMLETMRRSDMTAPVRTAARHGAAKSLRRGLQPWRRF